MLTQNYYLSGKAEGGPTQILHVLGRTVEQTAELGRLLGFLPETILVCCWPREADEYPVIEITPSAKLVIWPGRN